MVSCFFGRSANFRENVETRNHGNRGWHTHIESVICRKRV